MSSNRFRFFAKITTECSKVTKSTHIIEVVFPNGEKTKFLVDCGLSQECPEKDIIKENERFSFDSSEIDFCVITHNHVDHMGRLPLLVKKGFKGQIFMTEDTKILLPIALKNSEKVLAEIARKHKEKKLYSEVDVSNAISKSFSCTMLRTERVSKYIKITYFNNAHLVGASIVLAHIFYPGAGNINLLFTGDFSNKNTFLALKKLPKWLRDLNLTVITESTYGDTKSSDVERCFEENITRCIYKGGSAIVPVFSLGRAQEILFVLKELKKQRELNPNLRIFQDGNLGLEYTRAFLSGKLHLKSAMYDFLPENFTFVDDSIREKVLMDKDPKIILTTSGMGDHGPAQMYIPEYIKRRNSVIHFTGYASPTTLGGRLKQTNSQGLISISGQTLPILADVEYTAEYSSHAKADELIELLKSFNNLKAVLITHGEEQVRKAFKRRVEEEVKPKRVEILNPGQKYIVDAYGLRKVVSIN